MLNVGYYLAGINTVAIIGLIILAYKMHQSKPHHVS